MIHIEMHSGKRKKCAHTHFNFIFYFVQSAVKKYRSHEFLSKRLHRKENLFLIYLFVYSVRTSCVCVCEFFSRVDKPEKLPVALFASRLCSKSVFGLPELSIKL